MQIDSCTTTRDTTSAELCKRQPSQCCRYGERRVFQSNACWALIKLVSLQCLLRSLDSGKLCIYTITRIPISKLLANYYRKVMNRIELQIDVKVCQRRVMPWKCQHVLVMGILGIVPRKQDRHWRYLVITKFGCSLIAGLRATRMRSLLVSNDVSSHTYYFYHKCVHRMRRHIKLRKFNFSSFWQRRGGDLDLEPLLLWTFAKSVPERWSK